MNSPKEAFICSRGRAEILPGEVFEVTLDKEGALFGLRVTVSLDWYLDKSSFPINNQMRVCLNQYWYICDSYMFLHLQGGKNTSVKFGGIYVKSIDPNSVTAKQNSPVTVQPGNYKFVDLVELF